jgi:DNA-binding response OmpR family regulator
MSGRILIVDDEPNQRRSLAIGLRLEGFQVLEAQSGQEALQQLDGTPIDLAIVDLMMPGMNGLDLSRCMRFRHPDVSVVLTSAYHLSENQLSRIGLDEIAFLPKPYCLDDLSGFLKGKLRKVSSVQ